MSNYFISRNYISRYYFLLFFCIFLFSCHPTQKLIIQDKKKFCDNYYLKINNAFELGFNADYTISGYIVFRLSIVNLSHLNLIYNTDSLNIESELFKFNKSANYISPFAEAKIGLHEEIFEEYVIKPGKKLEIESAIYIKDISKDLAERWPWPNDEKVKLELGEILLDEKTYPLGFVYITHESVIEKEKL